MMQNLTVFQWQGENQLWDAIQQNLDAAIDVELVTAVGSEIEGEARVQQCGRADGLLDFKSHLVELRDTAMSKLN